MKILYIPAILLFLAFLELPYGYYTLLRLVVTGVSLYAAFGLLEKGSVNFWVMLAIAVLFNPLIPVHLSKEIWIPIDIIVGIYFAATANKKPI
ncbi:MAG: hypothetical protein O3C61_07530 [Proteobacteria bacterium]|nr:hypothetical protein [Pseudomonadota bacterium]